MSLLDLAVKPEPRAGNLAAWFLSFHDAEPDRDVPAEKALKVLGFDQYHAEITAALPAGLSGGSFSITLEGITDSDYAAIRLAKGQRRFVRLYLGWADTNASVSGYMASVLGVSAGLAGMGDRVPPDELLVAVLAVDSVTRKAGARRYEATIVGRDWLYVQADRSRTSKEAVKGATRDEALKNLLEKTAGLRTKDYTLHPLTPNPDGAPPAPPEKTPVFELPGDTSVLEILKAQAEAMALETNRHGRGMVLLRDGVLQLGERKIPSGDLVKPLTLAGGLVETEALDPEDSDPDAAAGKRKPRDRFKLTVKGRPDLKPGDVVKIDAPPEDVVSVPGGVLGAIRDLARGPLIPSLGGEFANPVTLYVSSVEHRLGRTAGFATTVTGVAVAADHEWDAHSVPGKPSPQRPRHANAELETGAVIRQVVRTELQSRAGVDVAEVRGSNVAGTGEPPGQTLHLWRGLAAADPYGYTARRGEIRRPSVSPATGAPYLTPFAFGKCGLVLPRYPGTRVVVIHHEGQSKDPVDAGALWLSGQGPDEAQAGDWWLSLPADLSPSKRTSLEDEETPEDYTGKVSQDLIDADGNRVIEVGELTIRVGRGALRKAGKRAPRPQEQDAVTIEHADGGAKLVLKSDGSILLKGANIDLEATGKITLKASQVDVP